MRSRIVIPAAILVTAAYVKGRLDAHLPAEAEEPAPIPVVTPGDPIRRAEAEAADALAVAEAQTAAAAAPVVERTPPTFKPHAFRPHVFARPAEEPVAEEPVAAEAPPRPVFEVPAVEWPSFEPEWLAGRRRPGDPPARPGMARRAGRVDRHAGRPGPRARDAAEAAALSEWSASVAPSVPAPEAVEPVAEAEIAPAPEPAIDPEPVAEAEPEAELVVDEDGRFSLGGWAAQAGHMAFCGVTFRDRRGAPVAASAIRLVPEATANVADGGLVVLADPGFAPDAEGFTLLVAAAGPGSFAASGRYEVVAAA